jgi:glycerol-3-phosphate O-acyltransferase/dihydroxyacetone phosphate acyltransferase
MIAYIVLRAFGRLALRWFYRDVEVVGIERLPESGPVLLASNHPNALVDALVVGCTLRRPVTLTAKATLLDNPVTRALLRAVGVVPLRRASDDAARGTTGGALDPARNASAFAAVLDVLERGGVVLLFPEGKSHSEPELAPLRTGLARIAFMARDERRLSVPIFPVGLTFERKWEPRSRVLIHVGSPVALAPETPNDSAAIAELTRRVDTALRAVTLNFQSAQDATRVLSVSTLLAEILDEFRPLHTPDPPLADSVRVAHRLAAIAPTLPSLDRTLTRRVEQFLTRVDAFEESTAQNGITPNDVQMSTGVGPGLWFVVREVLIAALAGPLALWGRINHWVPLRIARTLAKRTSRNPDEPAMHTIVAGLVLVLAFYVVQTSAVGWAFGWLVAVGYAVSLPLSATWDLRYADRMRRAMARIRTYLRLRRETGLQQSLMTELVWLREEAIALDTAIDDASRGDRSGVPTAGVRV